MFTYNLFKTAFFEKKTTDLAITKKMRLLVAERLTVYGKQISTIPMTI